jgi:general secretion pathway protein C
MVALDFKKATLSVTNIIRPGWFQKMPTVVSFVLLIAIAYSLAQLTWLLMPDVEQQHYVDPNRVGSTGGSAESTGVNLPDIANLHLFGKPAAVVVDAPPVPEEVPETKLRLELKGILASSDLNLARAIVAEPPRSEDTYAVGAALPGGVTLVEIHEDHIVLSRAGQREKLMLPRDGMQTVGAGQEAPPSPRRAEPPVSKFQSASPAVSNSALPIGKLSELRDVLNNDPQSLMGLIDAKPEVVDGKVAGFRLDNMQNDRLLTRFGLRRGDVITAVNDIRLDGPANLPELLNILKTADQVKIEYSRRGRPRSVVLNMDE